MSATTLRYVDRALIAKGLFWVGCALVLLVIAARGPDAFLWPAFFVGPILAAIDTYQTAKKNDSTDAPQQALVTGAKVLAIVFLAWVVVVEVHALLPGIESVRENEPVLLLAGFMVMASSMLVAAPTRRVRLRVVLYLATVALIGLAAIARTTPGLPFQVAIVLAMLAAVSAVVGYLLARRDPGLQ